MSDALWRRYARLTGPNVAADIDDEMELHLQLLADKYARLGHHAEEARAMAVREFGDRRAARAECVQIDSARLRRSRRSEWLRLVWHDVRLGARRLRRSRAFAAVTVLTLAIGMGPTIAIFGIVNSVLLRPLPYADPDRLVQLFETFPLAAGRSSSGSVSLPNYQDWRAQARSFTDLAIASYAGSVNLESGGEPERLTGALVGANLFPLLGVRPLVGRTFAAGDDSASGPPVVVLSETLWRRRFAGDPAVVGKSLVIDGAANTVIGVLPGRVVFPNRSAVVDLWLPLQRPPTASRGAHNYVVVGRLRPDATVERGGAEMRQLAAALAAQYPTEQEGRSVDVVPLGETVTGSVRPRLLVLLGAAALVLLIAAANAASLLLARAAARRREVAVLAALGATQARVARQYLTESLLLSAAGALLAVPLALAAVRAIRAGAGSLLPRSTEIHFDGHVVLFVGATVLLTTLLFGLLPALHAARGDLQRDLRDGGREGSGGRGRSAVRNTLVVAQFAISLVLLAGAGLLLRTFAALLATPTGMQTAHALALRVPVPVPSPRYPTAADALTRFWQPALERVRAIPGVAAAGTTTHLPLREYGSNGNFAVVGKRYAGPADQPFAEFRVVSPGYFASLGIPLQLGRDVAPSDGTAGAMVAVVNDALARKYFPAGDAIGQQIQLGPPGPDNPPMTVVGVAGSARQATLDQPPMPELYFPYTQMSVWGVGEVTLVVRAAGGDPARLVGPVREAIRAVDPSQPVADPQPMDAVVRQSVGDRRLYLGLLGAFAAVALALAVAGIYGVTSYAVTQRTREFGIRFALGSGVGRVQRLVVWHGARLALLGLVIGVPAAAALTRLIAALLYGVAPWDPLTFGAVALLLAGVSVLASYLPARRVARVEPIVAMRGE